MLFASQYEEVTMSAAAPAVVCHVCSGLTRNPMRVGIGVQPCSTGCSVPLEQEAMDVPVCSAGCAQAVTPRTPATACGHLGAARAV